MFKSQGKPARPDHLRFSYLSLEPGKQVKGWITGPVFGCETHFVGSTKPCLSALTEGELPCKYCTGEFRKSYTVYQPFWSVECEKMVAILGENMKAVCDALPFGEQIIITKGKHKNRPYKLRPERWSEGDSLYVAKLQAQHDVRPWLIQLWAIPELVEKYGLEPECIAVPGKPLSEHTSKKLPVLSLRQATAEAARRFRGVKGNSDHKFSANGNHKADVN